MKAKALHNYALAPALAALAFVSQAAFAEEGARWRTNMTQGVTEVGHQVYDLHMAIFWICVVIGIVVFALMFGSLLVHRKSLGHEPATFHENTKVEILWTALPFFILIGMAVPATSTLINIYDTSDADVDVLVTGYQWKWKYEYIDKNGGDNISYFSNLRTTQDEINGIEPKGEHYLLEVDEPMVIPVNKKTRLLVTASDVIHSWWVPALSVKKDAIPGFINEAQTKPLKTGVYRGQCAELCGKDHGFMPIVVNVVEQEQYDQWLGEKKTAAAELKKLMAQNFSMDELMSRGEAVYQKSCLACHGANGEGGVGKKIAGSPIATGAAKGHLNVVVNGVPGTAMQAFGGQLNDVELAAVITYQRNAWGNNMGDKLQPVDIYKFKKGQ